MEIIRNMPEREYRARRERSQSDFKHFRLPTHAHAKYAMDQESEESDSMLNGSCFHALALEGKQIFSVDLSCKTQKNPKQDCDDIALSPHNAAIVRGMAEGVKRNKGIMLLLESAFEKEVSLFWDGMKARLDAVCPLGIIDLKSTKGGDLWQFSKSMSDYGYAIQAAHYLEGAAKAGFPAENFFIVAAENFPPFEAALYVVGHESIENGRLELMELREKYFSCQKSGIYSGYSEEPVEINLPAYKFKERML